VGIFQFGGIQETYIKAVLLIFAAFIVLTNLKKLEFRVSYTFLYLGLFLILLSAKSLKDLIEYSPPVIFLLVAVHLTSLFEKTDIKVIPIVLRNLVVLSIVGTILKLFIFGIDESYLVGLMTMTAGEIGLIFPAFILVFYVDYYKEIKKIRWVLLYLFLFGVINEKRSIVFVFPILFLILGKVNLRRGFFFVALLYPLAISLIPSLNRDEKIFGSVDLVYPFTYAVEYLMADYGSDLQGSKKEAYRDKNVQLGRVALFLKIRKEFQDMNSHTLLFGTGLGRYTNKYGSSNGIEDNLFKDFGYRGNLSSFLQVTLESGLLSIVSISIFIYMQLRYYLRGRMFYAILIIYIYDIFFYGQTSLKVLPISLYIITLIPLYYDHNRTENSRIY
jgi:hypothetical protein